MSSGAPVNLSKLKPEQAVKELAKKKSNRNCFDCGRSGPQHNVNSTTNTFVCTQCAGLHRKYNHKVKTISMSTFTAAEVDALSEGGNKRARRYWLAIFEEGRSYPIDQEDPSNIDRFMQLCYVDKKWAKSPGATSPRDDDEDSVSRTERKKKKADKEKRQTSDRAFTEATFPSSITVTTAAPAAAAPAAKAPAAKAPAASSTLDLGIDFLSNLTVSTPAQTQPAAAPAASISDDFGFDDEPASHAAPRFDSNAQDSSAGLFDSAPLAAPAASAGSNSSVVQSLVNALRSVQSSHGLSISQLSQAVQSALAQLAAGGGVNGAAPTHARTHTPVAPLQSHTSTPAPAATLEDAFADIAIPDDSAAGGADTGNPFDSSDDEEEQSPSTAHSAYPQHSPSTQLSSPQQQQQSPHMAMHAQPPFQQQSAHFPMAHAQGQQMSPQQQLQFQQQMMFQQQMLAAQQQQQQHGMQGQQAFGGPQHQANGFNAFAPYATNQSHMQHAQQQQQAAHPHQASPQQQQQQQPQSSPQFQVQAAQPPAPAAPAKPDLFAGLGGLSGF